MLRKRNQVIVCWMWAEDMDDTTAQTVLGRKAAAGREERKARAMTLQKALRLALAKVADSLLDMPMAVIGAVVQPVDGDEIEAIFEEGKLLLLMDGPARAIGAVMIDPIIVGALIQQQTLGTVMADLGDTRAMTRTDAAICAPLIDTLIARAAPILDDENDCALIDKFTFGAKAEDARTLALSLDASDYVSIKLTVDVARGVRQGDITLVLPSLAARSEARDDGGLDDDEVLAPPGPDLTKMVMGLNAELEMVVCQVHVPLHKMRALSVGDTVDIVPGTFPSVQITTRMGRVLGRGLVGHVDGVRAVRPTRAPAHANKPMRRVSDQEHVEMPEVEVLTPAGLQSTVPRELDVTEEDVEMAMQQLSAKLEAAEEPPTLALPHSETQALPEPMADLPDLDDLPDLEALPNLEDMPNLEDLPDLEDLPMLSAG